eukprot:s31_g21.t1
MVVKLEVNKAIRLSDSDERPQILPFLLSEKVDFKSHDPVKEPKFSEEKFQMWFHLGFARKFRLRLHRQILLMAFMTVMDVMHMEHTEAWEIPDKDPGLLPKHPTKRFAILLSCRAVILAMGLGWSFFARTDAFRERVQEVQWGLVLSTLIVASLMFVSYDALIYPQIQVRYTKMHFLDYVNQQQSLIFVLAYFIVTNTHPTLFYQSLVYIPLGMVFMYIRNRTSLYISDIGRVMFLCTVVISCLLAHVLEQTSRARFKTKQRVEETQDRVETVLSNLMPKKVLEEIKLSALEETTCVSAGFRHTVLLRSDGNAVACGRNLDGQCTIPPLDDGMSYTQVSAGLMHTVLLRSDGTAVACGHNLQVSAGLRHTVLLRSDGTAVAGGENMHGQCTIPPLDDGISYTQVSAGSHHTVLLGSDGSAVACGWNLLGQCNLLTPDPGTWYVADVSVGTHLVLQLECAHQEDAMATSREGITQISRACKDAIVREHLQQLGDAAREATLTDVAALEKLQKEFEGAIERSDAKLTTSKGEEHDYSEVGGRTFLIYKDRPAMKTSRRRESLESGPDVWLREEVYIMEWTYFISVFSIFAVEDISIISYNYNLPGENTPHPLC